MVPTRRQGSERLEKLALRVRVQVILNDTHPYEKEGNE
jgi:hypothetical protein